MLAYVCGRGWGRRGITRASEGLCDVMDEGPEAAMAGTTPGDGAAAGEAERWLDEHGRVLFCYAMARVRSSEAAEDLVQETLLAAWRDRSRFDGRSTRRTWLIGILRHKIADYGRRTGREAAATPAGDAGLFGEQGIWRVRVTRWRVRPDDSAQMEELRGVVARCLGDLPPRLLEVFRKRLAEHVAPERICNDLAISPTHLRVRLHRARMLIRQCLEQRYFHSERA